MQNVLEHARECTHSTSRATATPTVWGSRPRPMRSTCGGEQSRWECAKPGAWDEPKALAGDGPVRAGGRATPELQGEGWGQAPLAHGCDSQGSRCLRRLCRAKSAVMVAVTEKRNLKT